MCCKAKKNYVRVIVEQAKSQLKALWKFTTTKLKMNADPEDPKTLCHDDNEKAEIPQKQFVSVFTREHIGPTP